MTTSRIRTINPKFQIPIFLEFMEKNTSRIVIIVWKIYCYQIGSQLKLNHRTTDI